MTAERTGRLPEAPRGFAELQAAQVHLHARARVGRLAEPLAPAWCVDGRRAAPLARADVAAVKALLRGGMAVEELAGRADIPVDDLRRIERGAKFAAVVPWRSVGAARSWLRTQEDALYGPRPMALPDLSGAVRASHKPPTGIRQPPGHQGLRYACGVDGDGRQVAPMLRGRNRTYYLDVNGSDRERVRVADRTDEDEAAAPEPEVAA